MKVIWTLSAEDCLDNIVNYIAEDNIDAALNMDALLRSSAKELMRFPCKGRIGRVKGTRELIAHPNYIIVYTVNNHLIKIISILHGSQQYPQ